MKVFEFDFGAAIDTVAADNFLEAIKFYSKETGVSYDELIDDMLKTVTEIPETEWKNIIFEDEDGEKISLFDLINESVTPATIASTEN